MGSYEFDFSVIEPIFPELMRGLGLSILLAFAVMMLSLPLGLIVALFRLVPNKFLNAISYVYVELLRTIPLIVVVVWFYFVPRMTFHIGISAFATAIFAFSLNLSAFLAETFRGSILSIDPGQRDAALASGMTPAAVMRRIILPQALMRSVPIVASYWVSLFKDTALVAVVGINDLMYVARAQAVITYRPLEILTVAALIYFFLTYPQSLLVNRLFERFRVIE